MSWCDKLASTPSIGIGLTPHFASGEAILTAIAPILDPMSKDGKPTFTVERMDPFGLTFTTDTGLTYNFDQANASITFRHRVRAKAVSGGPPTMELLTFPMPFTELLPKVADDLVLAALKLPNAAKRGITRIGVVSSTSLSASDLPPGIGRLIKYIGRPWDQQLDAFNIQVVGRLERKRNWQDRCIYNIIRPEDEEQLLTCSFDWQRRYDSPVPLTAGGLADVIRAGSQGALAYFETLAEGNKWDEDIIGIQHDRAI